MGLHAALDGRDDGLKSSAVLVEDDAGASFQRPEPTWLQSVQVKEPEDALRGTETRPAYRAPRPSFPPVPECA
ncbi:hypothetical protein IscW_ISCW020990 [Ixodes scapularis]|uniref:Uncharacterized protein n=1 Tax=Ixodes scapularis TaxID=6945 RepID=B7Q5T1_IXOSC|nr:hypothetical protein IscW_ISCW020990 [Ixodes scapularis]|eukprot:XP_002402230.1 hypothetical protein IscW_ISCW020990 [Ixodes scapularis]